MPAAISTTMIAAATTSTTMQKGGHQRVLATNWVRCCHRSLRAWPARPATSSQGVPVTAAAGDDDEGEGHAAFDGDDLGSSVGYGETDVDSGDHDGPEGIHGRTVQPPEDQRRPRFCRARPRLRATRHIHGEIDPHLIPVGCSLGHRWNAKSPGFQGLLEVGETGFEPATARPPAGGIRLSWARFGAPERCRPG